MLGQFRRKHPSRLRPENLAEGVTLFGFGLFKKTVLADGFAFFADPGFTAATAGPVTVGLAWTSALAYTLQIYFDFSGYSDMAVGLGRMFGIRLPINFNSPYKSTSIIDFWRSWHITLSRFLRDYLYVPLGGNRLGLKRMYVNLLVTMILGGLWHGASWNFVLWGGLHGFYLCINRLWRAFARAPMAIAPAWLLTFAAVVVAWVPFRAADLPTSRRVLASMCGFGSMGSLSLTSVLCIAVGIFLVAVPPNAQSIMALSRPALGRIELPRGLAAKLIWRPSPLWAVTTGFMLLIGIAALWSISTPPVFIYFNF